MRLIGIGLLAFVLAAAAITLSYLDVWQRGTRAVSELALGPQLVFESQAAQMKPTAEFDYAISRASPRKAMILSGVPSYQSAVFPIPVDVDVVSGFLRIDATMQVLNGVEGALRVSIDNSKRGEILLRPGEIQRSLKIPLLPEELLAGQVPVSFSLQGRGSAAQCVRDDGIGAVVEIEQTSAAHIQTNEELKTIKDLVASWGDVVRIGWPDWLDSAERPRRIALGAALMEQGYHVVFHNGPESEALTTTQLRSILDGQADIQSALPLDHPSWPLAIAASGQNAGARWFDHQTTWRSQYDLQQFDGAEMASALQLELALGFLPPEATWTISATLNGHLIHSQAVPGDAREYVSTIALPAELQNRINTLEVQASSSHSLEGVCNREPDNIAEMKPQTMILGGGPSAPDNLVSFLSEIEQTNEMRIGLADTLSAAQATHATEILARIGQLSSVDFASGQSNANASTNVQIVSGSQLATMTPDSGIRRWAVWTDKSGRTIEASTLNGLEDRQQLSDVALAVVIEVDDQSSGSDSSS